MIRVCKENRVSVLEQVRNGKLDSAMLSSTNLIDEIILAMHDNHLLSKISESIPDLRAPNTVIPYDVVCVLFGYLFFQLYTMLPEGEQYLGRSLPVVLKGYNAKVQGYIVLYVGIEFGILTLLEMMKLYAESEGEVREKLDVVMGKL